MGPDRFHNAFLPRRSLGRTGFIATQLGIGDVADRSLSLEACVATVRRAIDAGLNVIDTAPGYEEGFSEEIVGCALQGCRDRMFLIDKIDFPAQPVAPQIEKSLERLKTDRVDLFVLHGLSDEAAWDVASAPGGAMDQLGECQRTGKIRFRGISSHHPDVLEDAIASGLCDVVLFPLGAGCDYEYETKVLPLARSHDVGTVCFKIFGAGKLLADTTGYNQPLRDRPRGKVSSGGTESIDTPQLPHMTVANCLHYTLTIDPDVTLLGLSFPNEQDAAFEAALRFKPLPQACMTELRAQALEALEGKGNCWWNPVY